MYLTYLTKPNFKRYSFDEAIGKAKGTFSTKEINNEEVKLSDTATVGLVSLECLLRMQQPPIVYEQFSIPKHSGGYRILQAPCSELKDYQRWICGKLNSLKVLPHNAAHGFVRERNCKTALLVHQATKARWFLKLDIKDFFSSCTKDKVLKALMSIYPIGTLNYDTVARIFTPCFYQDVLPQGAPTSPVLSNLFMLEADIKLSKIKGLCYTRYADDMLFSCTTSFEFKAVVEQVKTILSEYGLELNERKIRYGNFNGRNWNLGIMYNNDYRLTVGHDNKNKMKVALHQLRDCTDEHKIASVLGLYAYYRYIEPNYFNDAFLKKYYK